MNPEKKTLIPKVTESQDQWKETPNNNLKFCKLFLYTLYSANGKSMNYAIQ